MRRPLLAGLAAMAVVATALGVGLGVGLTRRTSSSTDSNSGTAVPTNITSVHFAGWTPAQNSTWDYRLLLVPSEYNLSVLVYDIDLFDAEEDTIASLQALGHKVICYFSAGSYENWRPDQGNFSTSDLGNPLDGWEGEWWLNTSSLQVREIMAARIDLAAEKNCDGIDPDNLDGYNNDNGLGLTEDDAVDYIGWLAETGSARNITVGLKNCASIASTVEPLTAWVVVEQCVKYDECDQYDAFISAGKPVFHVEYPKGDTSNNDSVSAATLETYCDYSGSVGFMTILKNMNLDSWGESCPYRNE